MNEYKRRYLHIAAIIICVLFGLITIAHADYFLPQKHRSLRIDGFTIEKVAVDDNGIYIAGMREEPEQTSRDIVFVRRYSINTIEHTWSALIQFPDFTKTISVLDMACINSRLHVVYEYLDKSAREDGFVYNEMWELVLDVRTGQKIVERRLGNKYLPYDKEIFDVYIASSGAVLIAFSEYNNNGFEKYEHGFLEVYKTCDQGMIHAITSDADGNIYIGGSANTDNRMFIMKYAPSGLLLEATHDYMPKYGIVEDIKVNIDGDIYLAVSSWLVTCTPEKCSPEWLWVYKFGKTFESEFCRVISAIEDDTSIVNCTLNLTETDFYLTGTLVRQLDFESRVFYVYIIAYNQKGEHIYTHLTDVSDSQTALPAKIFLRREVELKSMSNTIDQLTLIIGKNDTFSDSEILSFWIPKTITIPVEYKKGWNLMSPPVHSDKSFLDFITAEQITVAYRFDPNFGYHRMRLFETFKPGIGYWIFAPNDFTVKWTGPEILSVSIKDVGYWSMLGSGTYPFFYDAAFSDEDPIVIYHFDPKYGYCNPGWSLYKRLYPAKGYWVYYDSEYALQQIDVIVNQEER